MPSSGVSDGVQSVITSRFPGTIYCAVETSGDGATNFYSRVQMYMFKARMAAAEELRRTYAQEGVTEEQVREFLARNPKFASPLHHSPHEVDHVGIAGSAAASSARSRRTSPRPAASAPSSRRPSWSRRSSTRPRRSPASSPRPARSPPTPTPRSASSRTLR